MLSTVCRKELPIKVEYKNIYECRSCKIRMLPIQYTYKSGDTDIYDFPAVLCPNCKGSACYSNLGAGGYRFEMGYIKASVAGKTISWEEALKTYHGI